MKAPLVGTVVLVTVWVVVSMFVHFTVVFRGTVMLAGLKPATMLTIETSVVPLAGHVTSWTVDVALVVEDPLLP